MSAIALVTFIEIYDPELLDANGSITGAAIKHRFQNSEPSIDGISHSPEDFSSPEAIEKGVNILLHSILDLDRTKF